MSQWWEARIRFEATGFSGASKKLAAVRRVLKSMSKVLGLRLAVHKVVAHGRR